MKSGSLNVLEPSGPHRACYRTPLPYKKATIHTILYCAVNVTTVAMEMKKISSLSIVAGIHPAVNDIKVFIVAM